MEANERINPSFLPHVSVRLVGPAEREGAVQQPVQLVVPNAQEDSVVGQLGLSAGQQGR